MPRIMPEPRYFSIPSIDVGGEVRMNRALNCWPWEWSLIHSPDAVTHSPAEMVAACPTTVISSRCPRALIRRTQKPLLSLWKVTRSTRPARTSWVDGSCCGFMLIIVSLASALAHCLIQNVTGQLPADDWGGVTESVRWPLWRERSAWARGAGWFRRGRGG